MTTGLPGATKWVRMREGEPKGSSSIWPTKKKCRRRPLPYRLPRTGRHAGLPVCPSMSVLQPSLGAFPLATRGLETPLDRGGRAGGSVKSGDPADREGLRLGLGQRRRQAARSLWRRMIGLKLVPLGLSLFLCKLESRPQLDFALRNLARKTGETVIQIFGSIRNIAHRHRPSVPQSWSRRREVAIEASHLYYSGAVRLHLLGA